jgi:UDPglucose 6-dehydrogenase
MPESCDKEFVPLLEQVSGKKINNDFGLVYSPEFIALGNIVSDMINPDLVLIGESNTKAGQIVEKASKSVIKSNPEIHHMALVNAEVVKIAINTFVTTKISFANMLSEICDKLPNADVSVVTNAVGSDSRIGKKYLKAALGYGGPCFPRDNIALTRLAENLGVSSEIPKATDEINKKQVTRVVSLIESFSNLRNVGILGLSYKPDTPVVDESQGIMIANLLVDLNKSVSVHDPFALTEASPKLDSRINIEPNLEQILNRSEILVISTPWKNYAALDSESLLGKIIIDSWRILDADKYNNVKIIHPGKFYARN